MTILEQIRAEVEHIPPLSQSALRLLQISGRADHGVADMVPVVMSDVALTANVLRMVNSAAFRPTTPIMSVPMAVSRLGEQAVIDIAMRACAAHLYDRPLVGYDSPRGGLWRHSLRTAISARLIARLEPVTLGVDIAYAAGLLHDMGKVVLSAHLAGKTAVVLNSVNSNQALDFLTAERDALGTDHCQVGATLAAHWKLPPYLIAVMAHHHAPAAADAADLKLAYVVHLADMLAMLGGDATGADALLYRLDERYQEHVHLSKYGLESLVLKVQDEFDRTVASLNLAAEAPQGGAP